MTTEMTTDASQPGYIGSHLDKQKPRASAASKQSRVYLLEELR